MRCREYYFFAIEYLIYAPSGILPDGIFLLARRQVSHPTAQSRWT